MTAVPITRPVLDAREEEAVRRVLRSGWVTQGPEVAAFEHEFALAVGAPYACATSSGTAALHLALIVAGVRRGDTVATVSHSHIATANSVRLSGAVPVFVDVDPSTFNIDPGRLEASITPETRAILCVHQLGMPCDITKVGALGRRYGIPVIEDAACAIGSEILWEEEWQRIGRPHGDLACFSFHPRKLLTTGEGGMITTANTEWDGRLRRLRHHGMTISDVVRHASPDVTIEQFSETGFNYRLSDVQAAIGGTQLARLPEIVSRRRALAGRYARLLTGAGGVAAPIEPSWARSNWQSYCVRLTGNLNQRDVMQRMLDEGIATRPGVMCAHREPAYDAGDWIEGKGGLSESERAQDECILLPMFHEMGEDDQDRVVGALRRAVDAEEEAGRRQ
jgi:dTDP-4-amino-4,6-dideoxygalactose transaminase